VYEWYLGGPVLSTSCDPRHVMGISSSCGRAFGELVALFYGEREGIRNSNWACTLRGWEQ